VKNAIEDFVVGGWGEKKKNTIVTSRQHLIPRDTSSLKTGTLSKKKKQGLEDACGHVRKHAASEEGGNSHKRAYGKMFGRGTSVKTFKRGDGGIWGGGARGFAKRKKD